MEDNKNKKRNMDTVMIDWNVKVSQDIQVIEIKPMSRDMSRTRLKPVFLDTGELIMIVPASSEESAKEKTKSIAQHIVSSGVWGMEIWDQTSFLASIKKCL